MVAGLDVDATSHLGNLTSTIWEYSNGMTAVDARTFAYVSAAVLVAARGLFLPLFGVYMYPFFIENKQNLETVMQTYSSG